MPTLEVVRRTRFLSRIPVYAAGLGFVAALLGVAQARNWSGWELFAASLAVGLFYAVTILVPWLIREQAASAGDVEAAKPDVNGDRHTIFFSHGMVHLIDQDGDWVPPPMTDDPLYVGERRTPVLTR